MNFGLFLTHLIFLTFIAASTAVAAPLCREILEPPTDVKLMDSTFDDLAKMKLQVDLKKSQGGFAIADRQIEEQYSKKKLELQKHLKLSDQEFANILRKKIIRKQAYKNKETFKEKRKEKEARTQEQKLVYPWLKTKTIDLPNELYMVETKNVSEKHNVAIYPIDKSPQEIALVDFNTGLTTTYKNTAPMSELIVPKDSDVIILTTSEGLITFNLVSKKFTPWNEVNEWRNSTNGSQNSIERQISTMTPDHKYLIHVIYKESTTIAAVIEIATGKIISTKELEFNNQFFTHATMLNMNKLALSGPHNLNVFDLRNNPYYRDSSQSRMETHTRTDNGRALIGNYNKITYRFDLVDQTESQSKTNASEHLAVDSDYVWRVDNDGRLERLRVHDLSIVKHKSEELQYDPKVYPFKPGLVLGIFLKNDTPIAIYDSHTLNTTFDFYGQFLGDNIELTSTAILRDGSRILIEYLINGEQKLEIWDLNQ